MSDPQQQFTGREYTITIAWLAVAIVFIPATVFAVRPGYLALSLALVCSVLCVVMAWVTWKRTSRLTIPSIASRRQGPND
jgi:apolipoprotein N-acyltransferase